MPGEMSPSALTGSEPLECNRGNVPLWNGERRDRPAVGNDRMIRGKRDRGRSVGKPRARCDSDAFRFGERLEPYPKSRKSARTIDGREGRELLRSMFTKILLRNRTRLVRQADAFNVDSQFDSVRQRNQA